MALNVIESNGFKIFNLTENKNFSEYLSSNQSPIKDNKK